MSHYDYEASRRIAQQDNPFYALIMAAMRQADGHNISVLHEAFPEVYDEFQYRYWSGGGLLPGEHGYNPDLDDNLKRRGDADLPSV